MLERLTIRDLALVERAEIVFGPGLNAVTGETGAGKSLLVQAVSLLVGERARRRCRCAKAPLPPSSEGEFRLGGEPARRAAELLGEWGVEFDGETVIIRREVQAGGRSRAAMNQSAVSAGGAAETPRSCRPTWGASRPAIADPVLVQANGVSPPLTDRGS